MRIDVVSIFPEYLQPLSLSLIGKAQQAGIVQLHVHQLRNFTHDPHRTVDDTPAGGGAGMVMSPQPWGLALDHILTAGSPALDGEVPLLRNDIQGVGQKNPKTETISSAPSARAAVADVLPPVPSETTSASSDVSTAPEKPLPALLIPTPAGRVFTQDLAEQLAAKPWLVFACGRYEGIDERVSQDAARTMEVIPVSIGDYVLAGGEVAALVIIEAVTRLLPGVLGNSESLVEESHTGGLLEYPVYTKPATWRDLPIPPELLSGHHAQIQQWRLTQRLLRTAQRRPDLLGRWLADRTPTDFTAAQCDLLAEQGWHHAAGSWQAPRSPRSP